MGYTIKDRETGEIKQALNVEIEGEFIKTDRGDIFHGKNVVVEKEKNCFVATAVGSDIDTINTLKLYRDKYLIKSQTGNLFVHLYYLVGPYLAKIISPYPKLKNFLKDKIIKSITQRVKIILNNS